MLPTVLYIFGMTIPEKNAYYSEKCKVGNKACRVEPDQEV